MDKSSKSPERQFVQDYLKMYSHRNAGIKNSIADDFSGLDGISNTIYDKNAWITAIDLDFEQLPEPFTIRITDFDTRKLSEDLTLVITVSLWDINLFQDFPEFDRIRTVFILKAYDNSFKITHLSNSVSLLSLERDEVYPITLTKFLRSWKDSLFGLGKNNPIDR